MTQEEKSIDTCSAWQRCLEEDTQGAFPLWVLKAQQSSKETGKHNQLCALHGEQGTGTGCFFRGGGSGRRKTEQGGGLPGEIVGTAQRSLEAIKTAMPE